MGEEAVVCDAERALQMQVRGESQIAQQVRDDMFRHAELADCELRAELDVKMAKPLQTSSADPLNASNQAVSASQFDEVRKKILRH